MAEFIQVGQQLLFNRRFGLCPMVQSSEPLTATVLEDVRDTRGALGAIIAQAAKLISNIPAAESHLVKRFSK